MFQPIRDVLLANGDHYLHLADLGSYGAAHQRLGRFYLNQEEWGRVSILNTASSGMFSSDRTIAQYASEIWNVVPCPVPEIGAVTSAAQPSL